MNNNVLVTSVDPSCVRLMRRTRRWTQDELSEASGLSLRTIQRAEHDGKVSSRSLKSLAAAFDVNSDDLECKQQKPGWLWWGALGLTCGYAGALLGGFMSLRGQLSSLRAGEIAADELGITAGITGATVGLCCALIGLLYRAHKRRLDSTLET